MELVCDYLEESEILLSRSTLIRPFTTLGASYLLLRTFGTLANGMSTLQRCTPLRSYLTPQRVPLTSPTYPQHLPKHLHFPTSLSNLSPLNFFTSVGTRLTTAPRLNIFTLTMGMINTRPLFPPLQSTTIIHHNTTLSQPVSTTLPRKQLELPGETYLRRKIKLGMDQFLVEGLFVRDGTWMNIDWDTLHMRNM
jgi:hypothetical protein